MQYLKGIGANDSNTIEDILIGYDFQSGSYVKDLIKNPVYKNGNGCWYVELSLKNGFSLLYSLP